MRKLLLMTLLMLVGGANFAWAQTNATSITDGGYYRICSPAQSKYFYADNSKNGLSINQPAIGDDTDVFQFTASDGKYNIATVGVSGKYVGDFRSSSTNVFGGNSGYFVQLSETPTAWWATHYESSTSYSTAWCFANETNAAWNAQKWWNVNIKNNLGGILSWKILNSSSEDDNNYFELYPLTQYIVTLSGGGHAATVTTVTANGHTSIMTGTSGTVFVDAAATPAVGNFTVSGYDVTNVSVSGTAITVNVSAKATATYYLKLSEYDLYVNIPTSGQVTLSATPCELKFASYNDNHFIGRVDGNYWLAYGTSNAYDMYSGTDVAGAYTAKISFDPTTSKLTAYNPIDKATRWFGVNSQAAGQKVYGDKKNAGQGSNWELINAATGVKVTDANTIAYQTIAWNGTSPVFSPTTNTNYASWNDAAVALTALSASTMELYSSVALTGRFTLDGNKTLSIIPMKDDLKITRQHPNLNRTSIWFLVKGSGGAVLNIGSSEHQLTIEGTGHSDKDDIRGSICKREHGILTLTNVRFKDFELSTEDTNKGYLYSDNDAGQRLVMKDVTVENCRTVEEAFFKTKKTSDDAIYLQGYLNIDASSGQQTTQNGAVTGRSDIYCGGRIRLGEIDGSSKYSGFSASNGVVINWNGATTIGTTVVAKGYNAASYFSLTSTTGDVIANGDDLKYTQAYTLAMNAYGAATLVLPFESTIPTGATCYTLNYTAEKSTVKATEVETTLDANTPVLVNAEASKPFKFVSTATSGDAATGSGTHTVGALTGVYETTNVPSGSYILWTDGTNEKPIGFYKSNNSTVAAYRAYLTADGAGARVSISFEDDSETTGVANLNVNHNLNDNRYYNLNGQRIEKPARGLYIVGGKKVVIK